jgi:hypothetical protein
VTPCARVSSRYGPIRSTTRSRTRDPSGMDGHDVRTMPGFQRSHGRHGEPRTTVACRPCSTNPRSARTSVGPQGSRRRRRSPAGRPVPGRRPATAHRRARRAPPPRTSRRAWPPRYSARVPCRRSLQLGRGPPRTAPQRIGLWASRTRQNRSLQPDWWRRLRLGRHRRRPRRSRWPLHPREERRHRPPARTAPGAGARRRCAERAAAPADDRERAASRAPAEQAGGPGA